MKKRIKQLTCILALIGLGSFTFLFIASIFYCVFNGFQVPSPQWLDLWLRFTVGLIIPVTLLALIGWFDDWYYQLRDTFRKLRA